MNEIPHFTLKKFMNFSRKNFHRTVELAKILKFNFIMKIDNKLAGTFSQPLFNLIISHVIE